MQFEDTFDFMPNSNRHLLTPPPEGETVGTEARSSSPYRTPAASGYGYRSRSPLPVIRNANPPNIYENVQEARRAEARRQELRRRRQALQAELHDLRHIVPNTYEEDGVIVIPRAERGMMTAPAPRRASAQAVPLRAAAAAPHEEPNDPRAVVNDNNNGNPLPRRNQRRRTQHRRSSRRRRNTRRRNTRR